MPKYMQISKLLEKRISFGDYVSDELPTEMNLASEIGVSRTTARKAIMHLIDRGILIRGENGRILCSEQHIEQTARIAFVAPAWPSSEIQLWRYALEQEAAKLGIQIRPIDYVHPDDPAIMQAADRFDGIFLLPSAEVFPKPVIERLKRYPRLVILGQDYSWANIFSDKHLEHVDCVVAQPIGAALELRIGEWWSWKRDNCIKGNMITKQFKPLTMPIHNAYHMMCEHLNQTPAPICPRAGQDQPRGLICCSIKTAIGVSRACAEHGLKVGEDVLIAAINGEDTNRYLQPSITCLETKDMSPSLNRALNWLISKDQQWDGPTLMEPDEPNLFVGESTGLNT
jgi:biotin operon repressor